MRSTITRGGIGALLAAVLIASLLAPPAASRPARQARLGLEAIRPHTVPGEIVVGYRRGASRSERVAALSGFAARSRWADRRTSVVALRRGLSVQRTIAALSKDPAVAYAEPNLIRFPLAVPNDPRFTEQWGLLNSGQPHPVSGSLQTTSGVSGADMKVTTAWDTTQGDDQTVIAILDSGVDITHPDLAANIWNNPGEIPGNGKDDDNNGYVDDIHGWDFSEDDDTLFEPNPAYFGFDHGTHVAGTAAAAANDGVGIAGVCPNCKIMVLKVFEPQDADPDIPGKDTMLGDIAAGIEAIRYATAMGADVINGSLGAPLFWSRSERNALRKAIAAGVVPVFAAGNERGDNDLIVIQDFDRDNVPDSLSPSYPASYNLPGLISVAASNDVDRNGYSTLCALQEGVQHWECSFTNFGRESVDLSAPGVDILSTVPDGYDTFDGTSMAAPHVAGLVGLVRSAHPEYTPAQIRNALLHSADQVGGLESLHSFPGRTATGRFTVSGGRADAAEALTAPTTAFQLPTDGNIPGARWIRKLRVDSVTWPSDSNDVYKKRLRKGVRYRVVLDGPFGADFDLIVYKPGVKEIWQLEMGCFFAGGRCKILLPYAPELDADERRTFRARRSGIYRFHVAAYLFESGPYSLRVKRLRG